MEQPYRSSGTLPCEHPIPPNANSEVCTVKLIATLVRGGRILADRVPPVSERWNDDVQLSIEIGDMEIASQITSCAWYLLETYR